MGIEEKLVAAGFTKIQAQMLMEIFGKKKRAIQTKEPKYLAVVIEDDWLTKMFAERDITLKQYSSWLGAFPDKAWIHQEIRKAVAWEESNPQRKKKNFAAFIARWLSKGWDTRRIEPTPGPTKGRIWGETEVEKYERELRAEVRMPK